jgi:hydroxymethylglutaryl-CoA reductase
MCEATAPLIETESGGKASVRVISNLSTERKTRVQTVVNADVIDEDTANGIVIASNFAAADPYRSATQNKGIMNGVSAVLMATSNDTRAVEAGAHAYAAITGVYKPLSRWWMDEDGDLQGEMEMPMSLGIIGGTISVHPTARVALKMMRVKTANELGCVAASVGLACNLGALHALVTEGISKF